MTNNFCQECKKNLPSTNRFLYCTDCFSIRKNDVCEVIDSKGFKIYTKDNLGDLEKYLSEEEINVRLDLHKVLDTIDPKPVFDNNEKICCISYVLRRN